MSEILEYDLKVKLKKATGHEFAWGKEPHQVYFGTIFYLKKADWQHVEGPYALSKDHVQSGEFGEWLRAGMVYVKA